MFFPLANRVYSSCALEIQYVRQSGTLKARAMHHQQRRDPEMCSLVQKRQDTSRRLQFDKQCELLSRLPMVWFGATDQHRPIQ